MRARTHAHAHAHIHARSLRRYWELGNSKIGAAIGIKQDGEAGGAGEEEAEADGVVGPDGKVDYRADSKFSEAMKGKTEAISHFAQTKTLQEQQASCCCCS